MNDKTAKWIFWSLYIIFIIVLILLIIYIIVQFISPTSTNISSNIPDATNFTRDIPDISNQPFKEGETNVKYDSFLQMDLTPTPVPYTEVCRQYCQPGMFDRNTNICTSEDIITITAFNNCINTLKPINSKGIARPVAISNGIPYFGRNRNTLG